MLNAIVSWALHVLGLPINTINKESLAKARPIVAEWVKLVKVFDSDSPKTALLNGDVDLGIVWSGEGALLWNEDKKFKYIIPAEGAHRFIDILLRRFRKRPDYFIPVRRVAVFDELVALPRDLRGKLFAQVEGDGKVTAKGAGAALERLDPKRRRAIEETYFRDVAVRDEAAQGAKFGTVVSRISHAKDDLAAELAATRRMPAHLRVAAA